MVEEKVNYIYDDDIGSVSLVDCMGSDITVVNSARVSFGVEKNELDERDRKLIRYLIRHRHTSTLEHNLITFKFCVPLFVRSQHHRHRTWSYNEISRRYTSKDMKFYLPKAFRTQHKSNRQASNNELINPDIPDREFEYHYYKPATMTANEAVIQHQATSNALFNDLLKAGVCREQARMVLPQNLYTEYYGTVNLSNLLKFIDLRIHSGAQHEIQVVAKACLDIANGIWPITVGSYNNLKE